MKISAVKEMNFKGEQNCQPVTQRHIAAISGANADFIEALDNLGLINRAMLAATKKEIARREDIECQKSLRQISEILEKPEFRIEMRDNGYFAECEDKYDLTKKNQFYVSGNKSFYTPVFLQERQYLVALEKLVKLGGKKEFNLLHNIANEYADGKTKKIKAALAKVVEGRPIAICIPHSGKYGTIKPTNIDKYVWDTIVAPMLEAGHELIDSSTI